MNALKLSGNAKYSTEKKFLKAAEEYFESISSLEAVGEKGGRDFTVRRFYAVPSIAGLTVYLGISKEEWCLLEKLYPKAAGRIRAILEAYLEEELIARKTGVTGIMFDLQANYGWKEKRNEQAEAMEVTVEIV